MGEIFGVKVGNGAVQLTSGETEGVVHVREEDIPFSFATFDTDAFDVILGNDLFEANPHIKYLSLQAPHHLLVQRHGQLVEIPLNEDTTPKPSVQVIQGLSLNLGADMKLEGMVALHAQLACTENYKLSTEMKRQGFADLSLEGDRRVQTSLSCLLRSRMRTHNFTATARTTPPFGTIGGGYKGGSSCTQIQGSPNS